MFGFLKQKRPVQTPITAPTAPAKLADTLLGMTTQTEREFLLNYARETYRSAGDIVDLGSWLGSFTVCLLAGLKQNQAWLKNPRAVHAYDTFVWSAWMERYYNKDYFRSPMKEGDNFLGDLVVGQFH